MAFEIVVRENTTDGKFNNNEWEVVDTTDAREEASRLRNEYELTYGKNYTVRIRLGSP